MSTIAVRRPRTPFRVAALTAASSLVIGLLAASPAVAEAAPAPAADLSTALCVGGSTSTTVTLPGPVDEPSGTVILVPGCVGVLDLNGEQVKIRNVVLGAGSTLTIRDAPSGGGKLVADASGDSGLAGIQSTGANLLIQGGTVEASGGSDGAGIGGAQNGDGGTVTISGGTVTAVGGEDGAGIGGGDRGHGGTVTISGGRVTATGGDYGAGIGGGDLGDGGTVTISGGEVTATGGSGAAGIGGARSGGGTVTISGGEVTATGGSAGAGIGGGDQGAGGTLTISGGEVTATGGQGAAGVGGGWRGDGGTVTISSGSVVATAGDPFPAPFGEPPIPPETIGSGEVPSDVDGDPGTLKLGPGAVRVDSVDAGLPVTRITFTNVPAPATSAGPSFFAPGGVQPSQPVASAAFVRADGSPQRLAASAPGRDQVRYEAEGTRVTLQGGPGTDVARGLVADQAGEVVCEVCVVGLAAGQVIEVWMFSAPRLVAAHLTDDAECQLFSVPLSAPLDGAGPVSSGAHTLQFTLATAGGLEAVNVGLTVGGPVPSSVPAGEGPALPFALIALVLVLLVGIRRMVLTDS